MGTYNIDLTHNFTGETGYVIIVPRKTTAPLADVVCTIDGVTMQTRKVYPFPHVQESMVVEGLDPVIYFFKCYRSADGVALDEQINVIAVNARTGAMQVLTRYEYVVDRGNSEVDVWADPATGEKGIGDTRLAGQQYYIEERGTGSFLETEIVNRALGGFDFADPEKEMENGGVYFAYVAKNVTLPDSSSTSSVGAMEILQLVANTTYDPVVHSNKILQAASAGAVLTLTLPALATLSDASFWLDSNAGTQRNFVLQLNAAETARFLGQDRNKIVLGKADSVFCQIKGNVLLLSNYSGEAKKRGQKIYSDVLLLNTFWLAGTGPHNLIDFPGVQEIINALPGGSIITSLATWNNTITDGGPTFNALTKYPNRGKWLVPGDGTFYFPDARKQFLRGLDYTLVGENLDAVTVDAHRDSQGPGGFQKQALDEHWHPSGTEGNPIAKFMRNFGTELVRAWSGGAGTSDKNSTTNVNVNAQPGDTRPDNQADFLLIHI